ncbi:MAG TPA: TonB-dependent receptor, partial [Candidatus Binatia bacterium]|nr:TonB-dependent receptor [Candidatus Binatia bacterium]
ALASPSCAAHAQDQACDGCSTDGIVVTGTRSAYDEEEAPVPVQVITREEIEETAADNIEAVISQVPDVYVVRNEQFGLGASTVRMQGLDANKVAILIDGHRFRGGVDGVVDLRDIAAGGLEQIEVLRGPASSLYGSDAMAGVLNIRTRGGGMHPFFRFDGAGGSAGRRRTSAMHGYHVGPLRYLLSLQHDAVAIADLYGSNISQQFAGERGDDLQERGSARLRLDQAIGGSDLRVVADYLNEQNPLSLSHDFAANSSWQWRPGSRWVVDADAGAYRYSRVNDLAGFSEDVTYYDLAAEVRAARPLGRFLAADHMLTAGLRTREETLDSPPSPLGDIESPAIDAAAWQTSPFLQTESLIGASWSLVIGLSGDVHELYGFEINPRATLTWRPATRLRFSATAGRGYRAPDLLQLFDVDVNNVVVVGDRVSGYAIVGNPDLEPETDIGVTVFGEYEPLRGLRLAADAFYHDLEDVIGFELVCAGRNSCQPGFESPVPELNGPVFSYQNIASARTAGVDATVQAQPVKWFDETSAHRLDLTVAAGWLDTENLGRIAGERGKDLPFRPVVRVLPSVAYGYEPSGTLLRVWGEYNGRQFSDQTNSPSGKIDPYWMWSARLTQSLDGVARAAGVDAGGALDSFELYVQVENLFGQDIEGGFGPAGPLALVPRRNVQAGIRWTYGDGNEGGIDP